MPNIIITGSTGFLGKNLLKRLSLNDDNKIWSIGRGEKISKELMDRIKPDYIYHFAAEIYDDSKMMESNTLLTYNLLESVKHLDFKCFVNIGSSSEYGLKTVPMKEDDVLVPRTMYEATKAASTLICQSYSTIYDKPIVTIRPFSVYGRYESSRRFIPTIAEKFYKKETIHISSGVHDFIYIDDFIDGVLMISNSEKEKVKGDIVNIGSGCQYSNFEVYNNFRILFGYDIDVVTLENKLRVYDSQTWVADISYAKNKYGFSPKYSFNQGLREYCNERFNCL